MGWGGVERGGEGDSEVGGGRVPPLNSQTHPSLSGGFPSVPFGIKGIATVH